MDVGFTFLAILMIFIVGAGIVLIDSKMDKDERKYKCYTKMLFKGKANAFGCLGSEAPECKKCIYHKKYLQFKEETSSDKIK